LLPDPKTTETIQGHHDLASNERPSWIYFLFAKPIHCPSIGQMHYKRTRKDYEQTTSRDSVQKAAHKVPAARNSSIKSRFMP
jgi:hypothetical protein